MPDITIRRASPADQSSLARFGGALMRLHHTWDPARFIMTDNPESGYGRFLVSALTDPKYAVFVAEREGVLIGYAFAGLEPVSWKDLRDACGFLHDVYVDESARRSGAGEGLVREAIEWLEAQGSPRVMLISAAVNEHAQHLFEKLGFRHTMVEMTRERGVS